MAKKKRQDEEQVAYRNVSGVEQVIEMYDGRFRYVLPGDVVEERFVMAEALVREGIFARVEGEEGIEEDEEEVPVEEISFNAPPSPLPSVSSRSFSIIEKSADGEEAAETKEEPPVAKRKRSVGTRRKRKRSTTAASGKGGKGKGIKAATVSERGKKGKGKGKKR